jgi:uncharacterized circularly permuted ATP-grasp superfamily protein
MRREDAVMPEVVRHYTRRQRKLKNIRFCISRDALNDCIIDIDTRLINHAQASGIDTSNMIVGEEYNAGMEAVVFTMIGYEL